MPGYSEREVKWAVDNARPKQIMIDLDANMVKVEFLSKPPKARIAIDGAPSGSRRTRGS